MGDERPRKWQPIMLMTRNRLECDCGSLAIFLILNWNQATDDGLKKFGYGAYCQSCYQNLEDE